MPQNLLLSFLGFHSQRFLTPFWLVGGFAISFVVLLLVLTSFQGKFGIGRSDFPPFPITILSLYHNPSCCQTKFIKP